MEIEFISLTSANIEDNEGQTGFEVLVNVAAISHIHKAVRREGDLSHVHFTDGKAILVSQSVEQIKALINPPEHNPYRRG